ncbi:MAG: phosphate ABC transporter ATP-binding protein [Candidatus Odinarchaeota archaeon]|nr:phosphate ABC transporter ATP-binding protein [Candidatus Odinarchaeota archaeon]
MMKSKVETVDLNVWYGNLHVLKDVNIQIPERKVTAIIGPSGCGKTTFLKTLNRLIDLVDNARVEGEVKLDGKSIYNPGMDVIELRRKVGMVFQKPTPLPKSIYENVAYGPRIHGVNNKDELNVIVEESLRKVGLWDEVKDRLNDSAFALSLGQQQRLAIARALAVNPEVLLMDEPASALDPISVTRIEELIKELKKEYTIVIVTHNLQQAWRISNYTAFFYYGELIEYGPTEKIFKTPEKELTFNYVNGKFG